MNKWLTDEQSERYLTILTYEDAQRLFSYDPDDGVVRHRLTRGNTRCGVAAGTLAKRERLFYRNVWVNCRSYKAHRITWLLHYGEWPAADIDHIDGDGLNNKISNLRLVTGSGNNRNTCRRKDNRSGTTGVHWNKRRDKWHAAIRVHKKSIFLGLFESLADAKKARKDAEVTYGFHINHGRAA